MATIVSSAAGPPPPPPPPPPLPPNWKPTDRPYLANHAKTKRRKKDEKAQKKATHNARVSTVWRLLHQQGTTPDVAPKRGSRRRRRAAAKWAAAEQQAAAALEKAGTYVFTQNKSSNSVML
ncbi:hypothetical protein PCG10_004207 [Penicillium crustosum]|uniref:Uncharacterized protein n=1 Tax=Penicillium crustosum TaxID=36656 RepID=A0A9P5GPP7_PENCR|nr:hypothetical protein PCG10_004207 [Penicillium crustosum]